MEEDRSYLENAAACYEEVSEACYGLRKAFHGHTVLCPCGDGPGSAFHKYFRTGFGWLRLSGLACLGYGGDRQGTLWSYFPAGGALSMREEPAPCRGSVEEPWVQALFGTYDIVATMPPDSLFDECLSLTSAYGKGFLFLGHAVHMEDGPAMDLARAGKLRAFPGLGGRAKITLPGGGPRPIRNWWRDETGTIRAGLPDLLWYTNLSLLWYTNLDSRKGGR